MFNGEIMSGRKKKNKTLEYREPNATGPNSSFPPGVNALVADSELPGVKAELDSENTQQEAIRALTELMKDPKHVKPLLIGTDAEGNLRAVRLKTDDQGQLVLPDIMEWHAPSKLEIYRKKRKVGRIMKYLDPILKRDIGHAAQISLLRKDDETLDNLLKQLKNKHEKRRVGLVNRMSCVYIEADDFSTIL